MQKMIKSKYFPAALAIYINYFVQGIQSIIISQGATYFAARWGATDAEVFGIIAAVGIGKITVMMFSGILSDKIGRKPLLYVGMIGYVVLFGGLLVCQNTMFAYILSIIAGGATSFIDGASYPALMEIFPHHASIGTVMVKGFISVSTAFLPMLISFLNQNNLWFGWAIMLPLVVITINLIFFVPLRFPISDSKNEVMRNKIETENVMTATPFKNKPHFLLEGIACMIFAFLCLGTFYLWQQTATKYAMDVVGMPETVARGLMTVYSVGSILSVVFSSIIMTKGIRDIALLIFHVLISLITLVLLYLFPSPMMMYIGSFVIGYFISGGILQIGSSLMSQFFPAKKGLNTSLYSVCSALPTYVMPSITQRLLNNNEFNKLLLIEVIFVAVAVVVVLIIALSYKRVFGQKIFSLKKS